MKNFKVIILAAGQGKRLKPLTNNIPKCLLRIGKETLLERQIRIFKKNHIQDILVVTGFNEEKIKKRIDNINFITNTKYDHTNSLYSMLLTKNDKPIKDTIIVNSDVLFHEKIIEDLVNHKDKDVIVIDSSRILDQEAMKVIVKKDKLIKISKKIDLKKANGENLGILKISKNIMKSLYSLGKRLISSRGDHIWLPEVLNLLVRTKTIRLIDTKLPWIEIDNLNDYEKAKNGIYPRIKNEK